MMTEREALFRIEALMESGIKEEEYITDFIIPESIYTKIMETINIAIAQGESDEN